MKQISLSFMFDNRFRSMEPLHDDEQLLAALVVDSRKKSVTYESVNWTSQAWLCPPAEMHHHPKPTGMMGFLEPTCTHINLFFLILHREVGLGVSEIAVVLSLLNGRRRSHSLMYFFPPFFLLHSPFA